MRLGALVACIGFLATAGAAETTTPPSNPPPQMPREYSALRLRRPHMPWVSNNIDAQVLANLFAADARSDFDVAVSTGTISCDARTCRVAISVRLPETTAPVRLSFAVASPRGELSEVRHAECLTSLCAVQLVLERGSNTIAVGASDQIAHAAGFATTQIHVDAPMSAQTRKSEWF